MNILHVNASDIGGGAARAAYRIHRSLVDYGEVYGLLSKLRVINRLSDDPTVIGGTPAGYGPIRSRLNPRLINRVRRSFVTENPTIHSLAWPSTGLGHELNQRYIEGLSDLVHLHWLGDSTLSIEEIGSLRMPLVWTMHDQWPFCGAEHYTSPPLPGETRSGDERFVDGYTRTSRPTHEAGPDLNRRTWLRKQRAFHSPISIVATSHWLVDCVQRSALMRDWPITLIPYPIDLDVWAPCEKAYARTLLGFPLDRPLVLFGAMGGTADFRKGADLLLEALRLLRGQIFRTSLEQLELVVFGQSRPVEPPDLGFPIHYMGHLHDDISLRLLYAAADVMVVPSRQEAFGQTASEAHACGTPVVAFRIGGLMDIVDDRITGALAEPFDPLSLASAIQWVLEDQSRQNRLGQAARARAVSLWNPGRIAEMYYHVYQEAILSASRLKSAQPTLA